MGKKKSIPQFQNCEIPEDTKNREKYFFSYLIFIMQRKAQIGEEMSLFMYPGPQNVPAPET